MLSPGSLLNWEWMRGTAQGREVIAALKTGKGRRRVFGLLEKPDPPSRPGVEEVRYKLLLVGKSGVGKTSTAAHLSGGEIPPAHDETAGVQTWSAYWPGRITGLNRVVMFRLLLWEAGEGSARKFDHILPACTDRADCVLFLFSFVDRSSFEEVPLWMHRLDEGGDCGGGPCRVVIGTKFDQHAHSEITQKHIRDFERQWNVPVLKIKNLPSSDSGQCDFEEVAPVLNTVCEHLWHRDLSLAGKANRNRGAQHKAAKKAIN